MTKMNYFSQGLSQFLAVRVFHLMTEWIIFRAFLWHHLWFWSGVSQIQFIPWYVLTTFTVRHGVQFLEDSDVSWGLLWLVIFKFLKQSSLDSKLMGIQDCRQGSLLVPCRRFEGILPQIIEKNWGSQDGISNILRPFQHVIMLPFFNLAPLLESLKSWPRVNQHQS